MPAWTGRLHPHRRGRQPRLLARLARELHLARWASSTSPPRRRLNSFSGKRAVPPACLSPSSDKAHRAAAARRPARPPPKLEVLAHAARLGQLGEYLGPPASCSDAPSSITLVAQRHRRHLAAHELGQLQALQVARVGQHVVGEHRTSRTSARPRPPSGPACPESFRPANRRVRVARRHVRVVEEQALHRTVLRRAWAARLTFAPMLRTARAGTRLGAHAASPRASAPPAKRSSASTSPADTLGVNSAPPFSFQQPRERVEQADGARRLARVRVRAAERAAPAGLDGRRRGRTPRTRTARRAMVDGRECP